ncbi:MAG: Na+-dependent transporter [Syntrophobacter sp.]
MKPLIRDCGSYEKNPERIDTAFNGPLDLLEISLPMNGKNYVSGSRQLWLKVQVSKRMVQKYLNAPVAILSSLGRQGTRAVTALVVAGIALPQLGALFKPYVTEAVFALLCTAFLRVDTAAVRNYLRSPWLVLSATAWSSIASPALFGATCYVLGTEARTPELFLGLMLQGVAPPMMASPALAALMGLDATLVLVIMITSTALIPLTAPLFAWIFVGPALSIPPIMLAVKLFVILAGSGIAGIAVRRFVGIEAIERQKDAIDGLNVIILFVFVAALMENVAARFLATPVTTLTFGVLAFAVFFAMLFLTVLVFFSRNRAHAVAIGFMVSQRNLGLMLAATSGALPDLTWLYFGLSQFPIYLSPQLLQPLARRILRRAP